MNRSRIWIGIAVVVACLITVPVIFSSQLPPVEKAAADKTMSGQLVKVDTTTKVISVKGPDQKEMLFNYNDNTEVTGGDRSVQGLTGKTGAQLTITYHDDRGLNLATKIEMIERQQ